jgi:peptide/nickel transport system substrate-binding protein
LNPADVMASGSTYVFPLIYSYLAYPDENGNYVPDLAESWVSDENGKIWRFTLRSNARFHNGELITAKAVAYALSQLIDERMPDLNHEIERIDSHGNVLTFYLKKPNLTFLEKIVFIDIFANGNKTDSSVPVGSGPYRYNGRTTTEKIQLKAFEQYYGGRPYIDTIVLTNVPDSDIAWYRLILGETDLAFNVSVDNIDYSRKMSSDFHFIRHNSPYVYMVLYNNKSVLFADKKIRKALTLALDRRYFIDRYLDPETQIATGYIVPDSPYHDPTVVPIPCRPYEALEILREQGWEDRDNDGFLDREGKSFEFELLVAEGPMDEIKIIREIQLAFYDLGIKVRPRVLSMPEMVRDRLMPGKFDAAFIGLNGQTISPENWWRGDPKGFYNFGSYHNPQFDSVLEKTGEASSEDELKDLCRQLDRILSDDQPASFLYRKKTYDLINANVKNLRLEKTQAPVTLLRRIAESYLKEKSLD